MRCTVFVTTLFLFIPVANAAELSAEEAIEQRQAAFKAMKADVKQIKDAMKAKEPAGSAAITEPAEEIVEHSKSLVGLFVADSYEGDTRAKKKIWKKWDDFSARQQDLIADAEQLLAASQAGSEAEIKDAFKDFSKNCKGCHMRYRQIL